jgi:hypothetical protein
MLQFQLFRIKVYPAAQRLLFDAEKTRPQMLREAVSSLRSADFRGSLMWHIGNVSPIDVCTLESDTARMLARRSWSAVDASDAT